MSLIFPVLIPLTIVTVLAGTATIICHSGSLRRLQYLFKPLTMLAIIASAALAQSGSMSSYGIAVVAGLVCSLVGDVFLINPARLVKAGISFFIAHLCYISAFASTGQARPPLAPLVLLLIVGVLLLGWFWSGLGHLKIPVTLYGLALVTMVWLACSAWLVQSGSAQAMAATGSLLFLISDALIAVKRVKRGFAFAELLILATYFTAQWLIALSCARA
jgi:uncharacterized membrane protein YhhN